MGAPNGSGMGQATELDRELRLFEQHKADYLECFPDQFVLIKGEQMRGPFPTAEAAYEAGLREYGLVPFLVRQVLKEDPVSYLLISFGAHPS